MLNCLIIGGQLVISITVDHLKVAAEICPHFEDADNATFDGPFVKITHAEEFAGEVARELSREREDGSTLVTAMLDTAFAAAVENGCEGVDHEYCPPATAEKEEGHE